MPLFSVTLRGTLAYMSGLVPVLALCSVFPLFVARAEALPKQPRVVIRRPTVIAFFSPVTERELERDPDTKEALADFQFYASRAREPLLKLGVDFKEVYARSFRVTVSGRTIIFHAGSVGVGYYFISAGTKPRVDHGVNTDDGIIGAAKEHFGIK
jgi:hypothetical protein